MDEQKFSPMNGKRKRSLSESDVDPQPQAVTKDSPLLKKSMLREQQKLLSNAPDQIANGALKEWKFAMTPKAVLSTTKSKSTSDNAEIKPTNS